ncbi:NACHT domain-containing protein [Streptomyces sp. NPDC020141]|uniref:NACHT domain-containing protein n=1 Tax=Streptomyces sp. NPDC020141 TaxID=3365065 RepID=UPI0037BB2731
MRYLLLFLVSAAAALGLGRFFELAEAQTAAALLPTLAPAYLAWLAFRADRAEAGAADLDTVADQLAAAVRAQWDEEVALRRGNDPYPLPVAWRAADDDLAEPWPELAELARARPGGPGGEPAHWPERAAGLAGQWADIAEVFTDRVPTRRMVILGEPGAGKSALLIRLLQDLTARRADGGPVPVLFSLASWDPRRPLKTWLAEQLRRAHPGLRGPAPGPVLATAGGPGDLAQALIGSGRVLPILDGLDELPPAWHAPALDALNRALSVEQPMVLACRAIPYRAAVTRQDAAVRLNGAAAVQLLPLGAEAAADYLRRDAGGPHAPAAARWDAVAARLGADTPVGQALSSPLGLFLARTVYNRRPHAAPGPEAVPHPDELCDTDAFPDRAAVDARLFQAFIPAAYASGGARPPRWTAEQAHRAFVFLARFLEHERAGSPDLAWWELPRALPPLLRRALAGLVLGATLAVAFGITALVVDELTHGFTLRPGARIAVAVAAWLAVGSAVGWFFGSVFGGGAGPPAPRTRLRWAAVGPVGAPAAGVAVALADPGTIDAVSVLWVVITAALAVGAVHGFAFGGGAGFPAPHTRVRWSVRGLVSGPAVGLVVGLGGTIAFRLEIGLPAGIASGLGVWIAFAFRTEAPALTSTTGPGRQFAQDRRAFVAVGLAAAFGIGLTAAATAGEWASDSLVPNALWLGLAAGIVSGLWQTAWAHVVLARSLLVLRREVPRDLLAFLRDAHEHRGVLRQVGAVYQFRHIDLQRRLGRHEG